MKVMIFITYILENLSVQFTFNREGGQMFCKAKKIYPAFLNFVIRIQRVRSLSKPKTSPLSYLNHLSGVYILPREGGIFQDHREGLQVFAVFIFFQEANCNYRTNIRGSFSSTWAGGRNLFKIPEEYTPVSSVIIISRFSVFF